jgi:hypothetical protein
MKSILNLPWLQSKWDGFRVEDLRVGLRTKLQGRVQGLKLPWVLSGLIDGVMAFSFPPMFHVLPSGCGEVVSPVTFQAMFVLDIQKYTTKNSNNNKTPPQ